jgi:hypothetical protein
MKEKKKYLKKNFDLILKGYHLIKSLVQTSKN